MTTRIYVPCDAAALSVGAEAVANAVHAEIVSRKLDLKLVRNGSRGLLWLEPLVEIETPKGRIGYGPVKASDIKGIFDAGLAAPHALNLGLVDEIPYLAKQQRLTFARCGITDPLSLEDYEAMETTLYLLGNPTNAKLLREGIAELDAGGGVKHNTVPVRRRSRKQ